MGRYRSRSRSPVRRKHYDEPRDRRRDRRSPGPCGLLVRNISLSARPEDIRVAFERFGPIKDVYLPKNYQTGEPRGFGFVKYRYAEDAAEAKAHLNCTVIGGREIRIVFAEENRKTPQEMRRVSRTSGPGTRGSSRRYSPPRFPGHRYRSYSRSASPARRDSRDRDHETRDDDYSPRRPKLKSRSVSPRDDKSYRSYGRSSRQSRPVSRSKSRSASPRDERNCRSNGRSSRQSRPMSKSNSPRIQNIGGRLSLSPRHNSQIAHDVDSAPKRLESPGRNGSSVRSRSRSHSPH